MLFGRSHCTWQRLADFPHCWYTKLETVITEINRNILTASLLIFLAKQPHRINTSSLYKAHEQADCMSTGRVNDSLNPKNFLYISRMLTFTVSWFCSQLPWEVLLPSWQTSDCCFLAEPEEPGRRNLGRSRSGPCNRPCWASTVGFHSFLHRWLSQTTFKKQKYLGISFKSCWKAMSTIEFAKIMSSQYSFSNEVRQQ